MEIFFSRVLRVFTVLTLVSANAWAQAQADFPSNIDTNPVNSDDEQYNNESQQPATNRHLSTHPSGAIGLFHTVSALKQSAGPYSFGIFAAANYYSLKDFPASNPAYITERFDSMFGFSYTPSPLFEVFMSLGFLTTNDEAPLNPLYRQNANIGFGGKFTYPVTPTITAGGMYWGEKRSAINVIPGSLYALNHELRGVITYEPGGNLRYNGNLGFRIDNNKRVTAGLNSDQRQVTITHAYFNQLMLLALSAEYMFKWASVTAEYSLDNVFSSPAGFSGQPQRITLGGRVWPSKDQALSLQLALDLGFISKTNETTVVKEPAYSFWFGLGYLFGEQRKHAAAAAIPATQTFQEEDFPKENKKEKPAESSTGRISGYITNIESGDPVEGAKIFLCNDASNPIVTDASGRYRSYPLKTGSCEVRIEHPNFKPTTETVQVSSDSEASFDFGILQQSKEKGALLIRVKDSEGNPTESTISFPENPDLNPVETNEFGQAKIQLPPGKYAVRAKAAKFKTQTNRVELSPKQDLFVDFALDPDAPAKPVEAAPAPKPVIKVSQDKKTIEISEKIQFEIDKALLTYNSTRVLDDVVKFMKKHTEIKKVQIGGHTDSTGTPEKNMKLSDDRAASVKNYLIKKGIDKKRLESKGFGQTKPISDNKTDEGKYQNRRVEFKIIDPAPPKSKTGAKEKEATKEIVVKPAAKPAAKPVAKPVSKTPAKPAVKK